MTVAKKKMQAQPTTGEGGEPAPWPLALPATVDLSPEALASRMLAGHQATIRVKNPKVAVARLAHIAETTLTLANARGFHSMSLRDLSEGSSLSMGALYAYFDSKETLLSMILDTVAGVVEEVLGRPPEDVRDPAARLRWLVATHVALTEAMLPWFLFVFMEAKAFPAAARAQAVASERRTEALIVGILEEGRAAGVFQLDDPLMTAALIKPMLQDWYVKRSKYRQRGVTPEDFTARLTAFIERALQAKASV